MNKAIFFDNSGRILRVITGPDSAIAANRLASDSESIVTDNLPADFSPLEYYVEDGTVKPCGPPPTVYHEFDYKTKAWVEDEDSTRATLLAMLRFERDRMLADTDWTQIPDAPITEDKRAEWREYRQELRDMPAKHPNLKTISEILFPEPPK